METPRDDQLAAELRAMRPTPRPEFAAKLDERAAAGFPRRTRLPRLRFSLPSLRVLIPAGALAAVAIVAASAMVANNETGTQPRPGGAMLGDLHKFDSSSSGTVEEVAPTTGALPSSAASAGGSAELEPFSRKVTPQIHHRAVEHSAEIVLAAAPGDVGDDSSAIFEAVHAHDGIVMRSSTREGKPGEAAARFELLIPSAKLSDALAALSGIDEVRSRHEATDDITAPTVGTAELLRDSKARIDSLLAQLEAAETEGEREAVEAELRQERRHRAHLQSSFQHLEHRAAYSRVLVQIETGGANESSGGGAWGVGDAMDDAGKILAVAAAVTVVALAILGPIALIALLAWLAHRAWVRRERRRVLS
jgi:hypothetical protein